MGAVYMLQKVTNPTYSKLARKEKQLRRNVFQAQEAMPPMLSLEAYLTKN